GEDPAPCRADQHDRHPRLLPEPDRAGDAAHRRCRIRHLPHAGDGGRSRAHRAEASGAHHPCAASRYPGRNEPGTCEINYPFLFRHLDAIGYRGWIGCEYKPRTTTVDGLAWYAALTQEMKRNLKPDLGN